MSVGILGTKLGMTQIFDQERRAIPVTVIAAGPCFVTQIKTQTTDGYSAIQLGYKQVADRTLNKPEKGHLVKSGGTPLKHLLEYRIENPEQYQLGQQITADQILKEGQIVDVTGTSIGKGFAGYQKRHNFGRGPMSHGSKNHRLPGSTGAGTTPGRVFPGKRMAGRLGGTQVTIKKLSIIQIDPQKNILLIKGAIPGKTGALVSITPEKKVGS